MPQRKIRRLKKAEKSKIPYVRFFLIVFIVVGIFFFLNGVFSSRYWDGKDKLNLVFRQKNGDVVDAIFDPQTTEITTIVIPGDTQLEVARGYGLWKLKSVWDLGKNEDLVGVLLAQTVTRSLEFPVFAWSDYSASGFVSQNPIEILRSVITPYKTNLNFGDKVALGMFSLKVKSSDRVEIDLTKTTFLKRVQLEDGTNGFVLTNLPSPKLYSNFVVDRFAQKPLRVLIKDGTGDGVSAKKVGEIVEVMGAKVSSVLRENEVDDSCLIRSKDPIVSDLIVKIFNCKGDLVGPSDSFDVEITLGNKFAQYF